MPEWVRVTDKCASGDAELLLVGNELDGETDKGGEFALKVTGMQLCEASAEDDFNADEVFLKLVDDLLKKVPLDI